MSEAGEDTEFNPISILVSHRKISREKIKKSKRPSIKANINRTAYWPKYNKALKCICASSLRKFTAAKSLTLVAVLIGYEATTKLAANGLS